MFVTLHTGSASLLFSAPRYETRHGHVTHTRPLYTAHRDTHLSLLGKILPPPTLPPSTPFIQLFHPLCCARQYSSKEMDCATDVGPIYLPFY
jgi:hypothetical protein